MSSSSLVDGLNDAIRENPLAASLLGAGVFWMLFGSKVPSIASAVPSAAKSVGDSVTSAAQKMFDVAGETVSEVAERAGDTAQRASNAVSETVARAMPVAEVDALKGAGNDALRSGVAISQRSVTDAKQRLSDSLERQPLLLGALGLVIGAGLASAFPATDMERDTLGSHAAAAREKIESVATDAKDFALDRGREVLDGVQREATAQGFSADAAKRGLKDAATKVKNVAGAAREAVVSRVS